MKIVPALLVKSQEEFEERFALASSLSDVVQIDIMDGSFVPFESWADPQEVKKMDRRADIELHLMVSDVQTHLKAWAQIPNVKRAIFHFEAYQDNADIHDLLGTIAFYGWQTGLAINPDTPTDVLYEFASKLNVALFMGVTPGQSGQPFEDIIVEKIRDFKKKHRKVVVAVDGGVSEKTIPDLRDAGAELFGASSAIFGAKDPMAAYKKLEGLL